MTLLKVVILGDPSVGKSKLANKFETYNAQIKIDGKKWNMEISTGQQSSMIPHELTEMHCCVLVFDVNNRKSFDNLPRHMDQFAIHAHPRAYDFKYIVLGNKTDEGRRVVPKEEALEWCSNNREALYFETSAKAGWNVELAFDHIIRAATGYSSSSPPTGPKIYNLQDLLVHDLHGIFFASRERRLEAHEVQSILGHLDSLTQYATMTPNYVQLGLFLTEGTGNKILITISFGPTITMVNYREVLEYLPLVLALLAVHCLTEDVWIGISTIPMVFGKFSTTELVCAINLLQD